MSNFKKDLMDDEGLRLRAYQDHLGVWTIGYGTNLQVLKITEAQAKKWLDQKLEEIEAGISQHENWDLLNGARKDVIRSMAYQMGVNGTFNFRMMWQEISFLNWAGAADQMRDSKWWRDPKTQARAERMAKRMHQGVWNV
jgi:lysozyme